ncbi:MAG: cobalamin B12-binding domain-containing protein [Syntrophales bacterium]|jgi:methylmalonyl-CoA mutase C-terminal domain/subunit|nr:cobalamin B12-binding domain-containing protein [Syntrophales bacterium]
MFIKSMPGLTTNCALPPVKLREKEKVTTVAKKIKVLLAKLGLDVHNRGIITVAKELGDAGMEIIYIGNSLPGEIVQTAIQEDVDVIGVSSLGGAHITLGKPLLEAARKEHLENNVTFVIGGVFPPDDTIRLKEIGFDAVFTPGATREEIVRSIEEMVAAKTSGLTI